MNQDIIHKFEKRFEEMKKELGLKVSLHDIDDIFFVRDLITNEKSIPFALSRSISHRICDTFMSWVGYLQGLLVPNPGSLVQCTESQIFNDEEKQQIIILVNTIMAHVSKNTIIGLTKDKKEEAAFIERSVDFWKKSVLPNLTKIAQSINASWIEKSKGN